MNPLRLGAKYPRSLSRRLLFLIVATAYVANGASGHAQLQSPRVAFATRVDHAPKLDGTLHDPIWQAAQPIRDFHQREPFEGRPATEPTEVRIVYTRRAVYFGIYCYSSEDSRHAITATQLRRDVDQHLDDYFEMEVQWKL